MKSDSVYTFLMVTRAEPCFPFKTGRFLPVLLLARLSKTIHPDNMTVNSALLWVLSDAPDKCVVDRMNGGQKNRWTNILTQTSILVRYRYKKPVLQLGCSYIMDVVIKHCFTLILMHPFYLLCGAAQLM